MNLCDSVLMVGSALPKPTTSSLARHLTPEWIEETLDATGAASLRRRRLPAEQVVWLVIGMALMRGRSIAEVAAKLDIALPAGGRPVVAASALAGARQRLGAAPLEYLFERTAETWSRPKPATTWRGLQLLAIDGTTLRVPDTAENCTYFGRHRSGVHATESGYPTVRMVVLLATHERLVRTARFAPCDTGELTVAGEVLAAAPANSLVILDRLYSGSPQLLLVAAEVNRHFLVKTKKGARWEVIRRLGEGDDLVTITVSDEARTNDPSLPRTWTGRAIQHRTPSGTYVLLTSLIDPVAYPADEIRAHYHDRWEVELTYGEIKTDMLDQSSALLRSGTIEGIHQELWGILLAYNLVRQEMAAIADEQGVRPSRVSFRAAFLHIVDEFLWCALATPGAIPKHLRNLRRDLAHFILPPRREGRSYPRVVKKKESRYTRKRSTTPSFFTN